MIEGKWKEGSGALQPPTRVQPAKKEVKGTGKVSPWVVGRGFGQLDTWYERVSKQC